jgi:cytochrome c oxidase assembly factor 2
MHHMHPRSRSTGALFTATLAVSFLVVGLPHILPCPVDRRKFADSGEGSDGKPRRRRRRGDGTQIDTAANTVFQCGTSIADEDGRRKRECPVPKPGRLVGQVMGFEQKEKEKPLEVVVKSLRTRKDQESTP